MKPEILIRPVTFKTADNELNVVEGYASVFDVVDTDEDVIVRGAFKKTVKERVPAGLVKFLSSHRWDAESVLGTVIEAKEDDYGLLFKAQLSAAPSAQEIRIKMLEGHINRLSFGFQTIRDRYGHSDELTLTPQNNSERTIRYVEEVKWYEVSAVPFAANEEAIITSVKAGALFDLAMAGKIDENEIKVACDRLLNLVSDERIDILKSLIAGTELELPPPTGEDDDDVHSFERMQLETQLKYHGVI